MCFLFTTHKLGRGTVTTAHNELSMQDDELRIGYAYSSLHATMSFA